MEYSNIFKALDETLGILSDREETWWKKLKEAEATIAELRQKLFNTEQALKEFKGEEQ